MLGSRLSLNRFAEWIERRSRSVQLWLWALSCYAALPNRVSKETPAASCSIRATRNRPLASRNVRVPHQLSGSVLQGGPDSTPLRANNEHHYAALESASKEATVGWRLAFKYSRRLI